MDNVVRMIYDGDYAPADRRADKPPELREARGNAYQSYAAFKKALTDEQLEAYEKMMEVQGEVAGMELREAFAVGARDSRNRYPTTHFKGSIFRRKGQEEETEQWKA